jgi:hypothetical protein
MVLKVTKITTIKTTTIKKQQHIIPEKMPVLTSSLNVDF